MKKFILTLSIIILFGVYLIIQRRPDEHQVVPPASLSNVPVTTPPPTADNATLTAPATPAANPKPSPAPAPAPKPVAKGQYRDGSYVGPVTDAYYGNVQVKAVVSGGKLTDVQFLQYPSDRSTSREINSQAMPYLTAEAIQAQSANVDIITGATQTSEAFIQSLGAALSQAKS